MNEPTKIMLDGKEFELSCHEVQPVPESSGSGFNHAMQTYMGFAYGPLAVPVGIIIALVGSYIVCQMLRKSADRFDVFMVALLTGISVFAWPIELFIIAGVVSVVFPVLALGALCNRIRR